MNNIENFLRKNYKIKLPTNKFTDTDFPIINLLNYLTKFTTTYFYKKLNNNVQ